MIQNPVEWFQQKGLDPGCENKKRWPNWVCLGSVSSCCNCGWIQAAGSCRTLEKLYMELCSSLASEEEEKEDSDDPQLVVAENHDIAVGGLRISESLTTLAHLNHQLLFSL